ncbi:MAG: glycosyltransferase [Ignavibacteriales bacterium]|nr:glycosyltransferase [Ignavibacteriales bacterium]
MLIRVCVVTTSFPRWSGDLSGIFIASLTTELHQAGTEFDVIAPYEVGCQHDEILYGAAVHRFSYWLPVARQRLASDSGIPSDLKSFLGKVQLPAFLMMYARKAMKYARMSDVVHAQWIFSGMVGLVLAHLYGKPLIITVHGSDAALMRKGRVFRSVGRFILDRAARIVVVSDRLKKDLMSIGIDDRQLTVIYNGVDGRIFSKTSKADHTKGILWVGRMSVEKNLPTLMRAFAQVVRQMPDATLTLVGDGDRRNDVEKLIGELGITSNVRLVGMKTQAEVAEYMKACDVFTLPSLSEGFPLTVIEAMSIGRPVVVAAVGALPDLVRHGSNGYLIDPRDDGQLTAALVSVLADPGKQRQVGEAAAVSVGELSWDRIAEKMNQVYKEVLRQPAS